MIARAVAELQTWKGFAKPALSSLVMSARPGAVGARSVPVAPPAAELRQLVKT